uniref:Tight junction associated protein 1 n=1 Tax=Paramormyrops kingsleyae TaxID=1676925 RepID=A0A3B3SBQ3_9TELE
MTSAAPARKPYRKAPPQHRENLMVSPDLEQETQLTDWAKVHSQQNEELRRRLSHTTHKMEAMEAEFEASRHYMQAEMGRAKDDLDKMRDKFRRLQNSYTASQRTNQDLEEKLHALLRKVEQDKKMMDQEIVELTNKLLDAKNTIDKIEELNERYRQDCNLAVQLLKCNKSHFRNHKFADLPAELQDMVNKHMKSSLPQRGGQAPDADSLSLTPADVVPTSVIARVLEKPEPLVLNSAQSGSSTGRPVAEDVFVHVDMTGPQMEGPPGPQMEGPPGPQMEGPPGPGRSLEQQPQQQNGTCRSHASLDGEDGGGGGAVAPSFEKLNPYPTPPPPHPLYPGRKVIEFTSDDKVKIPKNSPLPNCTYATRQAISLSLVQTDDEADGGWRSGASSSSGRSSPLGSPTPVPGAFGSSASSEEDLLANWQRMFVEKMAPSSEGSLVNRTSFSSETAMELQRSRDGRTDRTEAARQGTYSDSEESAVRSWTASRESSVEADSGAEPRDLPVISRPGKSPKRMGVHHLHRKDSLTRAQEHGTLLD